MTLILVILAAAAGFAAGILYRHWNQLPETRELGVYRTWLWRSDMNDGPINQPGTKFRFSLDGRKSIWWAQVKPDGSVGPGELVAEPLPYLEGPPVAIH
ncbi:MAG: hypothetical protein WDN47_05275 [Candidatus Doudnabacteria bacterium]